MQGKPKLADGHKKVDEKTFSRKVKVGEKTLDSIISLELEGDKITFAISYGEQ